MIIIKAEVGLMWDVKRYMRKRQTDGRFQLVLSLRVYYWLHMLSWIKYGQNISQCEHGTGHVTFSGSWFLLDDFVRYCTVTVCGKAIDQVFFFTFNTVKICTACINVRVMSRSWTHDSYEPAVFKIRETCMQVVSWIFLTDLFESDSLTSWIVQNTFLLVWLKKEPLLVIKHTNLLLIFFLFKKNIGHGSTLRHLIIMWNHL